MKTILVTGANGFVGRHLCRRLADDGLVVLAGARRPEAANALPRHIKTVSQPDLDGHGDWRSILSGVDAVVHLASRDHFVGDGCHRGMSAFRRTNVEGTRRLTRACVEAGVERLVYLSSIKAVGEGAEMDYRETTPCRPRSYYGQSKLEAEAALREMAQDRLETVILRPPLVYGPEVGKSFLRLMKIVRRRLPLPLGLVRNTRSMVYVGNLVDAIRVCLTHSGAVGELFHVADSEALSTPQLVSELTRLQEHRLWLAPVPPGVLRLLAGLLGKGEEIESLIGSLTVCIDKIRNTLNWTPPFSTMESLRATAAWFQESLTSSARSNLRTDIGRRAA